MIRKPALGLFVYAFFDPARIIDQDRPPKSLRKCYPLLDHLGTHPRHRRRPLDNWRSYRSRV